MWRGEPNSALCVSFSGRPFPQKEIRQVGSPDCILAKCTDSALQRRHLGLLFAVSKCQESISPSEHLGQDYRVLSLNQPLESDEYAILHSSLRPLPCQNQTGFLCWNQGWRTNFLPNGPSAKLYGLPPPAQPVHLLHLQPVLSVIPPVIAS